MAFALPLAGSLLSGLFSHQSGGGILDGTASSGLTAELEADSTASSLTQMSIAHKSTAFADKMMIADEEVREASLSSQFTLSVQGSDQNIIKKSMQMVDQASQSA